jgi:hypothetical protein
MKTRHSPPNHDHMLVFVCTPYAPTGAFFALKSAVLQQVIRNLISISDRYRPDGDPPSLLRNKASIRALATFFMTESRHRSDGLTISPVILQY